MDEFNANHTHSPLKRNYPYSEIVKIIAEPKLQLEGLVCELNHLAVLKF
jgi:hypothetical protein